MENAEISRALGELADLLEIQGEANPFRIRAYRNALRAVAQLSRPLAEMVAAGEDLTKLPDIGKTVASHVVELVQTGELSRLDEIAESVPRSLTELVRLQGVGPKKAARLWRELEVTTVADLARAIEEGRVQALSGFGQKSADKIKAAIESRERSKGRLLVSEAERFIRPLLRYLEKAPGLERLEVAGSFRRRRETIGDLDLLATVQGEGAEVVRYFVEYPGVERVTGQGETKGSVVLRSGPAVDLRVVDPDSFGAAMQYFTGSKEHNVELRAQAVRAGFKVSEWGVFRVDEGGAELDRVAGAEEEEVYATLGLPWIPPELRENRGEIAAGRSGTLPTLIEQDDLRGELHAHTEWSDGSLTVRGLVEEARRRGLTYIAITDHTPAVGVAGGLTEKRVRQQWEEIARVQDEIPTVRILRGLEVDILRDGSLDMSDNVLEGLDFVVVAVHTHFGLHKAQMTERVLSALSHPCVHMLAHPTGRLLNRRDPSQLDVEAVLQLCRERDIAVEVNASPRRLDLSDVHLMRARELDVPVAITTDVHKAPDFDKARYGVDQARRAWLEPKHVLNTKSLDELLAWLAARA